MLRTLLVSISRLAWVFSLSEVRLSTLLCRMLFALTILVNLISIRNALWKTTMKGKWCRRKLMVRRETTMANPKMALLTRVVHFWKPEHRWLSFVTTMSTTLIMNYRWVTTMMMKQRSRRTSRFLLKRASADTLQGPKTLSIPACCPCSTLTNRSNPK